jgi:hypothetical protein
MPGCGDGNSQPVLSRPEALLRCKLTRDDQMHAHAENMEPASTEEGFQYIEGLLKGHVAWGRRL